MCLTFTRALRPTLPAGAWDCSSTQHKRSAAHTPPRQPAALLPDVQAMHPHLAPVTRTLQHMRNSGSRARSFTPPRVAQHAPPPSLPVHTLPETWPPRSHAPHRDWHGTPQRRRLDKRHETAPPAAAHIPRTCVRHSAPVC
jgi:hypothetical protein